VLLNVPLTPPMVSVVVTVVPVDLDEVWLTHTDWPGPSVPARLVNVPVQSIEYLPPATVTGVAVLKPVGVTGSDTIAVRVVTSTCGLKPKASGVPSIVVSKVAVTLVAWFTLTMHEPVPVQAPDQPAKVEPVAAAAVRVTLVPETRLALQVLPQLMPAGELVTVPLPAPALLTLRV
jgi:hypothetical protein